MHFLNPATRRDTTFRGLFAAEEYDEVRRFFESRPELRPTPLVSLPSLARVLGLEALDVKDETGRFGLNAFKILGVSYALQKLGDPHESAATSRRRVFRHVVCATAGNHGRAVARAARDRQLRCTVFLPALRTRHPIEARTRHARISAMRSDGADVVELNASYEEAVAHAKAFAEAEEAVVVSDTSWEGDDTIPRWIMAGYTQLFAEASRQWIRRPDVVLVQGGVGGLVCAAASVFAWMEGTDRPFMIACEPEHAACLLASATEGRPVTIGADLDTIMAGLRCAEPSPAAWPAIAAGIDAFVTTTDAEVERTLDTLLRLPEPERIAAGPSGACGLAALATILHDPAYAPVRRAARMDRSTRVLAVVTEGA
jgi:diaminopropionate ammonia-lyase